MSRRDWEFEIALLLFAGFFIAALFILGTGTGTASALFSAAKFS
jgi:hypothetical protein